MGEGEVAREQVLAEVALGVAPDGVDVVGLVLGAVVFDEEARGLQAVVVGLARLDAARPGEAHGREAAVRQPRALLRRQLVGQAVHVERGEGGEALALARVEGAGGDAARLAVAQGGLLCGAVAEALAFGAGALVPGAPPGMPMSAGVGKGSAPASTRGRLDCTMSGGAAAETRAAARWPASRERSSSRARSSSPARGRSSPMPRGEAAGFAPKKTGVGVIAPSAMV